MVRHFGHFARLLSDVAILHPVQDGEPDVLLERLTYFSRLISETYAKPDHPIRLVRLVAALEAFTLVGDKDKAHTSRIAADAREAVAIQWRIARFTTPCAKAYRWRNAVVHGDAPRDDELMSVFRRLERNIVNIYLRLLTLNGDRQGL